MRPLIFAFVLAACGSSSGDKDGELPGPLRSMAGDYEITDWSGYELGDATLWRVTPKVVPADADSSARIIAVTGDGTVLEGKALWARVADPDLGADELARRAFAVLLSRQGEEPLSADSRWVPEADRALVGPPVLHGGVLTFWGLRGSMSPEPFRYEVTVPGGEVTMSYLGELRIDTGAPAAIDAGAP